MIKKIRDKNVSFVDGEGNEQYTKWTMFSLLHVVK
jgi:hypothetical protein